MLLLIWVHAKTKILFTLTFVVICRHLILQKLFDLLALPSVLLRGTLSHKMQRELPLVVNDHHLRTPLQQQADLHRQIL